MISRKPGWMALLALALWPAAGMADLMLTGTSLTGALNMQMASQEKIWIRNGWLRRDFVDRGRAYTHLFDLANRRAAIIDPMLRMAEVYNLTQMRAATEVSASRDTLKMSFEPTGKTRPLRHWKCEENTLTASMPARLGNEDAVFRLKGQVWVASEGPELADAKESVKLIKKPDFFIGIPALARTSPAQTIAMSELIRKLLPEGLPCGGEIVASYEGNGPMANMTRRMPTRLSLTFQDFSSEPIKPEVFMIPAGYRVVQK